MELGVRIVLRYSRFRLNSGSFPGPKERQSRRAIIYTRISTADQNSELQLREIQDYADRQRWEIVETYVKLFVIHSEEPLPF